MSCKTILRDLLPIKVKWPRFILGEIIKHRYKKQFGYSLNWNNLQTFNEKIQWYKQYYDNTRILPITDKLRFKTFVKDCLGTDDYTARLFGAWDNINGLKDAWESLPNEFVLKGNLSYGGKNIIFVTDKKSENLEHILSVVKDWLNPRNTMMNTCSCRFYQGTPVIIAEEFLKIDNSTPNDYKFFCFDGQPYCLYVATGHFKDGGSNISFYDLDWNLLDVKYDHYEPAEVEKPAGFDKMLDIAKKVSQGFPFVRVDFFDINGKIYLSELTFDSGDGHKKFHPSSFDKELGSHFNVGL